MTMTTIVVLWWHFTYPYTWPSLPISQCAVDTFHLLAYLTLCCSRSDSELAAQCFDATFHFFFYIFDPGGDLCWHSTRHVLPLNMWIRIWMTGRHWHFFTHLHVLSLTFIGSDLLTFHLIFIILAYNGSNFDLRQATLMTLSNLFTLTLTGLR